MKKIAILPTLCTLGNVVCGLAALVFAAHVSVEAWWDILGVRASVVGAVVSHP